MPQTLCFSVRDGETEHYTVTFTRSGANLSAYCTCAVGRTAKYCDHRFAILEGDFSELVSGNRDDLALLRDWFKGSDVEAAMIALSKAKGDLEIAKEKVAYCRKVLAKRMLD